MSKITAELVKDLRERTGAGMMDCKKALVEVGGDSSAAIDWLRTKGLASAAKKAGRLASDGLVGVVAGERVAGVVEVNSETDFVARNEQFQDFVDALGKIMIEHTDNLPSLLDAAYPSTARTVKEQLNHMIATVGENMIVRRADKLVVGEGMVAVYVHNALRPGLGRIGVAVALESRSTEPQLTKLGKDLAMHIAASNPLVVHRDDLTAVLIAKERAVQVAQAKETGKADNVIEKMVEGRMRKYYEEVCLLDQAFVMDAEFKVAQVVESVAKELSKPVKVAGFIRYQLGEGIANKEESPASDAAVVAG